jgi:hypothetical protein
VVKSRSYLQKLRISLNSRNRGRFWLQICTSTRWQELSGRPDHAFFWIIQKHT